MADSILEQIRQKIRTALGEISGATVTAPRKGSIPVMPSDYLLVLSQGDDTENTGEGAQGYGPSDKKSWIQPFFVDVFVMPTDSSTDDIEGIINNRRATVEAKLREDPTWSGLAQDTRIRAPIGFVTSEGIDGIRIAADVHYRHDEDDPFTA